MVQPAGTSQSKRKRREPDSVGSAKPPAKRQRKPSKKVGSAPAKVIDLPHNLGTITVPELNKGEGAPSQDTQPNGAASSEHYSASWTAINVSTRSPMRTPFSQDPQQKSQPRQLGIDVEIAAASPAAVKGKAATTPRTSRRKARPVFNETPFPEWAYPTAEQCEEVSRLLATVHGEVKAPAAIPLPSLTISGCGEVPSVLDALIRTLLSGATTGNNSAMAFQGLVKKFGVLQDGVGKGSVNWNKVREATVQEIRDAIKSGGLADTKSKHIKEILTMVYEQNIARRKDLVDAKQGGDETVHLSDEHMLSLDHMHGLSKDEAMQEFIKYPGIGVKTAACVVLFCLRRPCFAVDTHVFRLCKWLGWVPPEKVNEITAFRHLEVRVPDHLKYSLHQLFIFHGKECPRCRAITGATSEGWEKGCVIDDLVKRTGKRKGSRSGLVQTKLAV
uniref:HhH-GPD domain-containing protein n=1 Tax=Coccidioides posadasii RMSCC 3488 TaxID=454284 RepID=A0A0J6FE20_COCPO|nr:hypothetical protein CPAG_07668 [Coccidioides posadasii RMSCC 3488]